MGKKRVKGEGVLHDETKKNTVLALTTTAKAALDARAEELGLSRSELVEQFARGLVGLPDDLTAEDRYENSKSASNADCPSE